MASKTTTVNVSVETRVILKLNGLDQYKKILADRSGPFPAMFDRWAIRYKTFVRNRYIQLSRGNGAWPALSPETIRRKKSSLILIEKGFLFGATMPVLRRRGWNNRKLRKGLRMGFSPVAIHPPSKLSYHRLAEIHQRGEGNVPVRRTIVPPNKRTIKFMELELKRAAIELDKMTNKS